MGAISGLLVKEKRHVIYAHENGIVETFTGFQSCFVVHVPV